MKKELFFMLFILFSGGVFCQITRPEILIDEAKIHDEKAVLFLSQADFMHKEGSRNLDSARYVSNQIQTQGNQNFNENLRRLEDYYVSAYSFIAKADSFAMLAENNREFAAQKTIEAYKILGYEVEVVSSHTRQLTSSQPPSDISAPVSERLLHLNEEPSLSSAVIRVETPLNPFGQYVIQLGAGNMSMRFFEKVPDIQTVRCKDGIKRFVLPGIFTREEAALKEKELRELGYEQIFIRTKESLDNIRN